MNNKKTIPKWIEWWKMALFPSVLYTATPNCGLLCPLPTYNLHTKCFMVCATWNIYNLFGIGQNAILHTICHTDSAAITWRIKPSLVPVVVTPHSVYARRTVSILGVCVYVCVLCVSYFSAASVVVSYWMRKHEKSLRKRKVRRVKFYDTNWIFGVICIVHRICGSRKYTTHILMKLQ